jgi:hypothetical protein
MLDDARIRADLQIVDDLGHDAVLRESTASSVTFLPFRLTEEGPISVHEGTLDEVVRGIGIAALVLARQDIDLDAEPEEGRYAEIARAVDAAAAAEKAARKIEKTAREAEEAAREARERLEAAKADPAGAEQMDKLAGEVRKTEDAAERSKRRAARARAKAEEAEREADSLTGNGQAAE